MACPGRYGQGRAGKTGSSMRASAGRMEGEGGMSRSVTRLVSGRSNDHVLTPRMTPCHAQLPGVPSTCRPEILDDLNWSLNQVV